MTTRFLLLLLLYELLKIEIEAKSTYHHVCRETKVCLGASSDFHTCIRRRNGEKKWKTGNEVAYICCFSNGDVYVEEIKAYYS